MGNAEARNQITSLQDIEKCVEFNKNYRIAEKKLHALFGDIYILEDSTKNEKIMVREQVYSNEADMQFEISQLRKIQQRSHANILKNIHVTHSSCQLICTQMHKLFVVNEYIDRDLSTEVNYRKLAAPKNQKTNFSENELLYILKSVVAALCYFQLNKRVHGHIRAQTIFITKNGIVKIIDPKLYNIHPLISYIFEDKQLDGAYLSPILLKSLKEHNLKPTHDQYKSDIYSLGCTMLELATMSKLTNVFDYANSTINENEINKRMFLLAKKYSQNLFNYVAWMMKHDEAERPDFIMLAKALNLFTVQELDRDLPKTPIREEDAAVHAPSNNPPDGQWPVPPSLQREQAHASELPHSKPRGRNEVQMATPKARTQPCTLSSNQQMTPHTPQVQERVQATPGSRDNRFTQNCPLAVELDTSPIPNLRSITPKGFSQVRLQTTTSQERAARQSNGGTSLHMNFNKPQVTLTTSFEAGTKRMKPDTGALPSNKTEEMQNNTIRVNNFLRGMYSNAPLETESSH